VPRLSRPLRGGLVGGRVRQGPRRLGRPSARHRTAWPRVRAVSNRGVVCHRRDPRSCAYWRATRTPRSASRRSRSFVGFRHGIRSHWPRSPERQTLTPTSGCGSLPPRSSEASVLVVGTSSVAPPPAARPRRHDAKSRPTRPDAHCCRRLVNAIRACLPSGGFPRTQGRTSALEKIDPWVPAEGPFSLAELRGVTALEEHRNEESR